MTIISMRAAMGILGFGVLAACGGAGSSTGGSPETIGSTHDALTIGTLGKSLSYSLCAVEGATCGAPNSYVAFGGNGSFVFKKSAPEFGIACTTTVFGANPAPGANACYAAPYEAGPAENAAGTANGPREIAFGANGVFNFQTITGAYTCNRTTFGDPLPNVVKACYSALPFYSFGASEGGTMTGLFNTPVAFGAHGNFVYKIVTGSAPCTRDFFGTDPAPGIVKTCYEFDDGKVADEGGSMDNTGAVAQGFSYTSGFDGIVNPLFSIDPLGSPLPCNNATFGDPHIGTVKHCYAAVIKPPQSCSGHCGGQAPGGCFCDSLCMNFGDCCADFTQQNCF
jgi:hypothetical protein